MPDGNDSHRVLNPKERDEAEELDVMSFTNAEVVFVWYSLFAHGIYQNIIWTEALKPNRRN